MSNKKRYSETPIHEYRIKYLTKGATVPNYHYYMCENAEQALQFQIEMAKHKGWEFEILKIEKFFKFQGMAKLSKFIEENEEIQEFLYDEIRSVL